MSDTVQTLEVALEEVSKLARILKEERDEARNASEAFSALAWKLEGERNEAREALRTLAEHGESEIQRVTKERDEAIADLEFRRGLYKVLEGANNHLMTANQEVAKLARILKEERDEARNASEAFSALAWKLEGERNEAREQAERYLAILKKHNLDQHGN